MTVNFQPLSDFVLIDVIPQNMTAGGIALPENTANAPEVGTVIAVGPGKIELGGRIPLDVAVGDIVYLKFAYSPPLGMEIDGKKYILCTSGNLVGKKNDTNNYSALNRVQLN